MAVTNRGKFLLLQEFFRNPTEFTTLYIALITSAVAPTVDTNTFSELTEIAAGNGYTAGGISLSRNSTDFDAGSPAAISPNATPSGGTASRGADKVESIGKQHRQQKTTILFMFLP